MKFIFVNFGKLTYFLNISIRRCEIQKIVTDFLIFIAEGAKLDNFVTEPLNFASKMRNFASKDAKFKNFVTDNLNFASERNWSKIL
jgi:hypothetical protein